MKSTRNQGVEEDEYVLKFKDESAYFNTLIQLEGKSEDERLDWMASHPEFQSLLQIYDEAMEEASELSFTEDEYKTFKEKYQNYLYLHFIFRNTKMIMELISQF